MNLKSKEKKLIEDRLLFVECLTKAKMHFVGMDYVKFIGENGWDQSVWRSYEALKYYLLLTCFDYLGQKHKSNYMNFEKWLNSEAGKNEIELEFRHSDNRSKPQIIKELCKKYHIQHGVHQAFKRFLNDILSVKQKEQLYKSIKIRKINNNANKVVSTIEDINKKNKFLFEIRNKFTHQLEACASAAIGLGIDHTELLKKCGKVGKGYEVIHHKFNSKFRFEYSVRDWPEVLINIVKETIETK